MKRLLALWLLMPLAFYATAVTAAVPAAAKLHVIGFLGEDSFSTADIAALQKTLHELGYVDGQTIAIETRFAKARIERLDDLANELAQRNVDIFVAQGLSAGQAARRQTRTVPIVVVSRTESIKSSGNVTGATNLSPELSIARLQLLKEIAPRVSSAAVLWHEINPIGVSYLKKLEAAADQLKIEIRPHKLQRSAQFAEIFQAMAGEHDNGALIEPQSLFVRHLSEILGFCAKARLAAISGVEEFAEAGGLISYGLNTAQMWRHTAILIDEVFKRPKPKANQPDVLPAEQPTKFQLVINLKTAGQLGIAVPQELLGRADKVIR